MKVQFCSLLSITISFFLIDLTESAQTAVTLPNQNTAALNSIAPQEFPTYHQNYTIIDNSSIRESLANRSQNDTEVQDLLENDDGDTNNSTILPIFVDMSPNPSEKEEDISQKEEVELIENGDNTEDTKISIQINEIGTNEPRPYQTGFPLFEGQIAAILAGTFLIIAIIAYMALLSWRRFLENRYGSREILVNEEDFIDREDLRHFSI